jgi:hypothetical protein
MAEPDVMQTKFNRKKIEQSDLVYPIDSKGDAFYPEAIKFTVYQRKGASLKKIQKAAGNLIHKGKIAAGLVPQKQLQEELDALFNDITKLEALKETDANDKRIKGLYKEIDEKELLMSNNANLIDFVKSAAGELDTIVSESTTGLNQTAYIQLKKEKSSQLGTIYLNMPNEINFTDDANWEGTDLGMVGGLAKGEGKEASLSGMFSNFANIAGGGTGALASLALKMGTGGAAAGAVLGMLGGQGLQKALESGTGQIANPYKEMTFSGIGFRSFSFNFTFRARNQDEVAVVQDIIKTFRYYSKPVYTHGKSGFFTYPEEFHIEFLTKVDKTDRFQANPYIPGIKMCVCKNVTTNFAPQNAWRSLEAGAPVEISLALTFEETELVTGEDVIGETAVGRFVGSGRTF